MGRGADAGRLLSSEHADWRDPHLSIAGLSGVPKALTFFALTTATQVCLLVQQVLILPLLLRVWGSDTAAAWFVALALANLAGLFDLGLRNAGHAELLAGETCGTVDRRFRPVWALARLLVVGLTAVCVGGEMLGPDPLLAATLTLATALETLLVVRGTWLDTLGAVSKVEGVYFGLAASRIVLTVGVVAGLRAPPQAVACIMLGLMVVALWAQARLRPSASLGLLAGGVRDIDRSTIGLVRFALAQPAATWMRYSAPVLAVAAIAPPAFVTSFVALRAVFGLARQIVVQLARYASVRYVQHCDPGAATAIAVRAILACTLIGIAVSSVVLADHGRALRLWFGEGLMQSEGLTLAFGVGAIAFGHQVIAQVLTRTGRMATAAKRQYAYGLAAGLSVLWVLLLVPSVPLYLVLLALQDLFLAGLFVPALGAAVRRAALAAVSVAGLVLSGLLLLVAANPLDAFHALRPGSVAISLLSVLVAIVLSTAAMLAIDRSTVRQVRGIAPLRTPAGPS